MAVFLIAFHPSGRLSTKNVRNFRTLAGNADKKQNTNSSDQKLDVSTRHQMKVSPNCGQLNDLIHLTGPLTEDAILKCLMARFSAKQYCVSLSHPRTIFAVQLLFSKT